MFIIVGVTGGIAAYKAVQLVRLLVLDGHEVHVIPTAEALKFVGAPTWEAISRHPVTTSLFDDVATVRHVSLGQSADLVVVAPATANFLAKLTAGIADDLLGTSVLAATAPLVVAPAMHTAMWANPATRHNIEVLRGRGVHIVGPADGPLTGGDAGPGRMTEPEDIHAYVTGLLGRRADLSGVHALVTAGGTREPIDPVRFIGNRSSGRQGVAVALAAAERGAEVTLVAAHAERDLLQRAEAHHGIRTIRVGTAAELGAEVARLATEADVVVMAAAVADYRVAETSQRKLTKEQAGERLVLELVPNDDVLAGLVRTRRPGQTIVGFAAETEPDPSRLLERARDKRRRKGADLLAVNEVGWHKGFESADNTLTLIGADDEVVGTVTGSKRKVADALWDAVLKARASG